MVTSVVSETPTTSEDSAPLESSEEITTTENDPSSESEQSTPEPSESETVPTSEDSSLIDEPVTSEEEPITSEESTTSEEEPVSSEDDPAANEEVNEHFSALTGDALLVAEGIAREGEHDEENARYFVSEVFNDGWVEQTHTFAYHYEEKEFLITGVTLNLVIDYFSSAEGFVKFTWGEFFDGYFGGETIRGEHSLRDARFTGVYNITYYYLFYTGFTYASYSFPETDDNLKDIYVKQAQRDSIFNNIETAYRFAYEFIKFKVSMDIDIFEVV